jgi:hypothetical protein
LFSAKVFFRQNELSVKRLSVKRRFGQMYFRSNGIRSNGDRSNGVSVKWCFGQMAFRSKILSEMVFRLSDPELFSSDTYEYKLDNSVNFKFTKFFCEFHPKTLKSLILLENIHKIFFFGNIYSQNWNWSQKLESIKW